MKKLNYHEQPDWPELAWLSHGRQGETNLCVHHGPRVETNEGWFGEIVWDGAYQQGAIDKTDVVFGSGGVISDSGFVFVASSNTLDRILSIEINGEFFVSNSIVCLAAFVGAEFSPWHPNYPNDFRSVIYGLDAYVPTIASSRGPIQLTYYRNLKYDGDRLIQIDKPFVARKRSSFDEYRDFLLNKLGACVDNMRSDKRKFPFDLMGTLSSGFDSTTAAALGKQHGLKEAITILNSRGGTSDCGTPVGQALGLQVHEIERDKWQEFPLAETLFLSADAKGEDVYFQGAGKLLQGKVLLTGYSGSIWGGRCSNYVKWIRTDQSGLSLTEYRLHAGAINLPVPSIGVYRADDLLQLMGKAEAQKWSNGKSYDKPFSRKMLTEAGVPDNLYGIEKKAASVLIEDRSSFLSDDSRENFENYLAEIFRENPARSFSFHASKTLGGVVKSAVRIGQTVAGKLGDLTSNNQLKRIRDSVKLSEFAASESSYRFLFPWAMEHAKQRYQMTDECIARK